MPAIQNLSHSFSDIDTMLAELLAEVDAFGGDVGFLVCDASVENIPALVRRLADAAPFPVVGCTTLAFPLLENRDEVSASLCVYAKEGLRVQVALSPPLSTSACAAQMRTLHRDCVAGVAEAPKLLYACVPLLEKLAGEAFMSALLEDAGSAPVFGGMASADAESGTAMVFANGACHRDRVLLMGLWGGIQPVFAVGSQITKMSDYAPMVTKSDGNVVYTVDDMVFYDYLAQIGLVPADGAGPEADDDLFKYGPLPVQLSGKNPQEKLPEIRAIVAVDAESGSGTFSAAVPEGTRLHVGMLGRGDIVASARAASLRLAEHMAAGTAAGQSYDLLLHLPCVARHFAQAGGPDEESALMRGFVPKGTAVHSYYSFCEISPFAGPPGTLSNRTYNHSIVLCAF